MRRLALALALVAAAAVAPGRASAQGGLERTVRFEVLSVGDSTFTFAAGQRRWIRARTRGVAVDPRRRDELVARFEVLHVVDGVATALVTGETTPLSEDHVAVLRLPARKWYRSRDFWMGAAAGLVAGVAGALSAS